MALKKKTFAEDEIGIFDDAVIYKRGDYWHFRMWLAGEGKYARKSLQTRSGSVSEAVLSRAVSAVMFAFINSRRKRQGDS